MQRKLKFKNIEILRDLVSNFSVTSNFLRTKIIKFLVISVVSAAFESFTLLSLFIFVSSYTATKLNNNFIVDIVQNFLYEKSYLGIVLIFSLVIITCLKVYLNKLQNKCGALMAAEIGEQYMSKVIEEGITNTTKENYDQVISVLYSYIFNIKSLYQALFGVLLAILSGLSISLTLFSISTTKTIVTMLLIGIFYVISFRSINKELKQNGKNFAFHNQKAISITRSILENLRIILLDNKKIIFKNYFVDNYKKSYLIDANIATSYQAPKYVVEGIIYVSIISIIILVEKSSFNFINLSELISIAYGILRLVHPTHLFFNFLGNLSAVSSQLKSINSKLFKSNFENSIKIKDNNANQINLDSLYINYSLKKISHKFENSNDFALNNINLDFHTGQKICITGKSGSGKSTLADILCGLLLPTKGKININGINLSESYKERDKWKKRISYIPQNFTMISDKIIENIILDTEDNNFDKKRVNACLQVAQIKSLLNLNKKDINQIANKLSGGQKQRINIARGLYKKADLYIFDEITSSLDVITKRKMISSIFNFLNGKTIFFITHDLSYLKLFDKVIFLDNGKIEIEGSYDYVIKNSIKFRDYLKQNKNYEAT